MTSDDILQVKLKLRKVASSVLLAVHSLYNNIAISTKNNRKAATTISAH